MNDVDDVLGSIRRTLRWLTAATVVLYVGLIVVSYETFTASRDNTDALCALRTDLQKRVNASVKFLVDHPNGVPGISAKVIKTGLVNQEQTIHALRPLSC